MVRVHAPTAAFGLALFAAVASAQTTALDRYVQKPDPAYKYELIRTIPGPGYTAYVIDLTSQQWRTAAEVSNPLWKHWLTIVKPDEVRSSTAFLMIGGGSVTSASPEKPDAAMADIAVVTHTVTAA